MQFVQSLCMKCLCLHFHLILIFPSKKQFSQKMFPEMVEKTKLLYVLLALAKCNFVTLSFDILMSKGMHDIFALVIKFLGIGW